MRACHIIFVVATALAAGCSTSSTQLGGGYYVRTKEYFSWEPPGSASSLHFRGANGGQILVWKNFTGRALANDGTAVFEGTTRPAGDYKLFAAKDGSNRFEIGSAILAFEASREHLDELAFVQQHLIATHHLTSLTNGVEFEYFQQRGVNIPHRFISLTWEDLSAVVRRVEKEGKLQKDKSGLSYLEIAFSQQTQ